MIRRTVRATFALVPNRVRNFVFAAAILSAGGLSACTPGDSPVTPPTTGHGGSGASPGTAGTTGAGGTVTTTGTAGTSSAGGTSAIAGTSGSTGAGLGGTGAAGTGIAGSTGTGGASAEGGGSGSSAAGRGGAGAGGGRAGATAGGSGGGNTGTGGTIGSGGAGSKAPVQASSGCGKTNPQTGSGSSPLMVSNHMYYVKLPTAYDGMKPFPVIFMFNPTNNPITWAEQNAGFEQNGAKTGAIRVYPHPQNSSAGWGAGDVSFFQPLYDQITSNFCVDKARVFATGESSGGDFSSILGCEHANKLRSAAPCSTKDVPQYPLDATKRKCTGEVTAVVMQGKNDNVVGPENGPKTRDFYVAVNHCGKTTVPVPGYTDTLSNCVQYQGCDDGYPVYWCQHTDPNYSGTNHGWPTFAPKFLWELWSSY